MQIPTNIVTLPTSIPVQVQQNLTHCFNCLTNLVKQPALYFCFDCQSYYCKDCNSSVHKNFSGHNSKLISEIEKNPNLCLEHQKKYEKYCYEHCSLICPDCFESKCQNHKMKTESINDIFQKIIFPMKTSVNRNSVEQSIEYLELKKQNLERQKQINMSALNEMVIGLQKTGEQIKLQVDQKINQLIKFSKKLSFKDTKGINSILTKTTRELSLLKNNVNLVQHFQELILQNEIIEATKIGMTLNPKFQMNQNQNQNQNQSNQFVNSLPQYKLTFDREVVNMINKMDLKQTNKETIEIKNEQGLERIPQKQTPQNLSGYSGRVNEIFKIYLTGANLGNVWGSDIYTNDSSLSKSVVHAGLLRIGESGWVKVKILPGQKSYTGTTRNGITTSNYGNYGGSYQYIKTEKISEQIPQNQTPKNLLGYRNQNGKEFEIYLTGANSGNVWGSDIYTDDSSLSKSVVHAGLLRIGESGWIKVRILPGQQSYSGTTRNGITTSNYGSYRGSYQFLNKVKITRIPQNQTPTDLSSYRERNNEIFEIYLTGSDSGNVWGSDIYTDDSSLSKSVIHAGLLRIGESGWVKVKILPGKKSYSGTKRNGITTSNYGNYGGSYQYIKTERNGRIPQNQTPRNISRYRGRNNEIFKIYLTGANSGNVWGSDIYTDDSSLSKSAVHAGLLRIGESGWVKVKILPGKKSYTGTTRNGIKTSNYGNYSGSYQFLKKAKKTGITQIPQNQLTKNLSKYRGRMNEIFEIYLTGANSGSVWGSDIYTTDSSLFKSVVHAGLLRIGESGWVKVKILPGQQSYTGTTKNGITTSNYGNYHGSYQFIDQNICATNHADNIDTKKSKYVKIPQNQTPQTLSGYRGRNNEIFEIYLTGANSGNVWGSDIYTDDSSLSKSVIHAGLLRIGESGWVKVKILPGKKSYSGTKRNGIKTSNYGNYGGSYQYIKTERNGRIPQNQTPRNLSKYRGRNNEIFEIYLTGANSGNVWGSDIYTADSSLFKSVVHAGLLRIGESGWVKVKILPGKKSYSGTTKNGITTSNYGNYHGSYQFVDQNLRTTNTADNIDTKKPKYEKIPQNQTPQNLSGYRGRMNEIFKIYLTGANSGNVWGSDIYTDDSSLSKSVVHAGLLRIGESGWVKVKILPGQQSYTGTTRNGIKTSNYGNYHGSYQYIKTERNVKIPQNQTPTNLSKYRGRNNEIFEIYLTGSDSGNVWGSDIYTDDSSLSKSVVHAGKLCFEESGWVKVKILPGQQSYLGTTRNGITTSNYGNYSGSYQFI
ncbi:lccl domain-containing protein [Anaeramoeba flamelloides]|uniref:Lccl domain-containing protein n=1 Tax=Anaeramoeba flamelloides TaxID=1746091 RepID=A0ABQ8YPI9_9EUKA|nr:lccl domain-containing protein [Anaeramoeba flamelloides]